MMLYVNGADIERLVLGLVDDGAWAASPEAFAGGPERFLAAIDAYLRDHHIERSAITGLAVVRGPGSSTALRSSLAIANAWGFAAQLPLAGLEKPLAATDADMLAAIASAPSSAILTPLYASPAKITASTKDALGRSNV